MELSKSQKLLYNIVYGILYVISLLPMRLLYVLSDLLSPIVRISYRKKLVRTQLVECFPEKTLDEIKQIEKKFYSQFCDLFLETIKQFSMSKEEMMKRMVFVDFDKAAANCTSDKTIVFMMLGHFGNWEWIASLPYWTSNAYCSQVYHPLSNDVFDKLFLTLREQYNGECIPMRKTVRRIIQLSSKGQPVFCGMIADQQPRWDAIHHFSPFLGHDSAVFIGTEQVAKKVNSFVFYGSVTRVKRGYYQCKAIPIALDPKSVPDYEITDRYMQLLEEDIRKHPEMWLWTHKRWTRTKDEWERNFKK